LDKYNFHIRVTGILIEDRKILLVKQRVTQSRTWSLPGGRVEAGELLGEAINREMLEETGLVTEVERLLYVCDKNDSAPPILHITFLLKKMSGDIALPSNEYDDNPISDVQFVDFSELGEYGFSERFVGVLEDGFSDAGSYMGLKENIGL